jgi:hypothetical protein
MHTKYVYICDTNENIYIHTYEYTCICYVTRYAKDSGLNLLIINEKNKSIKNEIVYYTSQMDLQLF